MLEALGDREDGCFANKAVHGRKYSVIGEENLNGICL